MKLKASLALIFGLTSAMSASAVDLVIATASGDYVPKAVSLGQDDFLPWKRGVSL